MFVNIIKLIHLLCVLGLLGSVSFCLISIGSKKLASSVPYHFSHVNHLNRMILVLSLLVMLTGTLLVHPKYFTFHTPWIQAAYILLVGFCFGILILKNHLKKSKKLTVGKRWLLQLSYLALVVVLIFIIHDAVTKTTFIL